jgi:chromosome segregation ATPase
MFPRGKVVEDVVARLDRQRQWLEDQRERLDNQARRIAHLAGGHERNSAQLARHQAALNKLRQNLKELQEKVAPAVAAHHLTNVDFHRMTSQLAAAEERLARVEQRLGDGRLVDDDESTAESRRLLEAVRAEHEQIRVRMQIVSSYEERLRRVEGALVSLYEQDLRDPV